MKYLVFALIVPLLLTSPVHAQSERQTPQSTCLAVADAGGIIKANGSDRIIKLALAPHEVEISFVAHSTFRLKDATGLTIATDYSGTAGNAGIPNVVTMNHAHITHWTPNPDTRIDHVLRGWGENGEPAAHNVQIGDAIIRNVTTDIRSFSGFHEKDGNSIFIFEMGGLCIGHLGHLHQQLSDEHYAAIGRLDVLMVPVDGGYTMELDEMIKVVERLNSSVILPMHWFGGWSLTDFLGRMKDKFAITEPGVSSIKLSLNDLPAAPTIMVLRPETFISAPAFED